MPTSMKVYLLSTNPIPDGTRRCRMHPPYHQLLQNPRAGVRTWLTRKAVERDSVDRELQTKGITPALAYLWEQDDFGLKVTGRGVL